VNAAVGLTNAVVWPCVSAHDQRMEYRGVRYTIRVGIEPDLWSVTIYPDGAESAANRLYGTPKNPPQWLAHCDRLGVFEE
jgi:hypothetical protein